MSRKNQARTVRYDCRDIHPLCVIQVIHTYVGRIMYTMQEVHTRYPSHDGEYRDCLSTFDEETLLFHDHNITLLSFSLLFRYQHLRFSLHHFLHHQPLSSSSHSSSSSRSPPHDEVIQHPPKIHVAYAVSRHWPDAGHMSLQNNPAAERLRMGHRGSVGSGSLHAALGTSGIVCIPGGVN